MDVICSNQKLMRTPLRRKPVVGPKWRSLSDKATKVEKNLKSI